MPAAPAVAPKDESVKPSWETQKTARTYVLQIPAPRGQIVDRNGKPLAQTRVSHNLAINFPTPFEFDDAELLIFAREQINSARTLTGRRIAVSDEQVVKHYRNRAALPLDIAFDLSPVEAETVKRRAPKHLSLQSVYQRFYPNGAMAGHIIGYAGRSGRAPDKPLENNDLLWPAAEGREGLEQTFNDQLTGKNGQLNITFDANGRKSSEKIVIPPQPGYNVVTTLDVNIQRIAEEVLAAGAKRGALVVTDPNTGDILAMASRPCYDPNAFVPAISAEAFKALQDDRNVPLLPRAFRSAYPLGSVFKVTVGFAALEGGKVEMDDYFDCPHAMQIGNMKFRNWKTTDAGMLDFAGALTQSCDTWFYQVGMKIGAQPIIDWAVKMGFGAKTGIPLIAEAEGRVPTQDYMKKIYGRRFLDGDIANLSIGQGDLLTTPLQTAQAMAATGNGGTLYRTRLVQQVQGIESQIITAYEVSARNTLDVSPKVMAEMKKAMIAVVSSPLGTAGKAAVNGIQVAGKTGTAQWGPKDRERNAAWFAGFAPADKPRYAFAAIYEGDPRQSAHGGTYAAPMIGKVLKELFKDEVKAKGKKAKPRVRKAEPVEQQQESD